MDVIEKPANISENANISFYKRKYVEKENSLFSTFIDIETAFLVFKKGKAAFAALLGTITEWYDYSLYGYMSAVLANHFFPNDDPTVSLIKHFAVFALGFIAKPLDSLIFGFIGDGRGRRYALRWSIVGIALPTALLGFLPSYNQWGVASVVILCVCRFIQGLFVSAETDGVNIFIYESLPKKWACIANSWIWISSSIGIGMASFAAGLAVLPQLPDWSWRLPFLFAGILGLVTSWFRRYLIESIDYVLYSANKPRQFDTCNTSWNVVSKNKFNMLLALLFQGSAGGVWVFYFIFWNNYLSSILHLVSNTKASFSNALFILIQIFSAPLCGYLADLRGTVRTIQIAGCLLICAIAVNGLSITLFNTVAFWLMVVTVVPIVLLNVAIYVTMMQLFMVGERYRCVSLSRAFGSMIFSSTAPLIGNFIWQKSQNPTAPLFYCALLVLIGITASLFIRKPIG
jgi:MHS family proline/betaine transporter-like MFS transporter